MDMLTLKNGSSEPKASVASTMMALTGLWDKGIGGMCTVTDLYELCRDPKHQISSSELEVLKGIALVQSDGSIHETVKNVVLSAISGEDFDIKMGSPLKENEKTS